MHSLNIFIFEKGWQLFSEKHPGKIIIFGVMAKVGKYFLCFNIVKKWF